MYIFGYVSIACFLFAPIVWSIRVVCKLRFPELFNCYELPLIGAFFNSFCRGSPCGCPLVGEVCNPGFSG